MRPFLSLFFGAFLLAIPVSAQSDDNPPWDYGRIQDKMTDHDTVYASLESSDGMYLTIERNRLGLIAYIYFLEDNDHLFFCSRRCTVEMRFDKGLSVSVLFALVTRLLARDIQSSRKNSTEQSHA